MATADIRVPTEQVGWLRRTWEKIATVLAVIGLIDVTGQLIHWAQLKHEIATQYAIVRAWLFSWLPFHIPPELHDPIVLFLILVSVTNIGIYKTYGITILSVLFARRSLPLSFLRHVPFLSTVVVPLSILLFTGIALYVAYVFHRHGDDIYNMATMVTFLLVSYFLFLPTAAAVFLTWRWLLTTAVIFGALVAINQVYVLWLEPLVEQRAKQHGEILRSASVIHPSPSLLGYSLPWG